ncbi:DUF5693 family protein [Paenibacillus prosopidis]|uniref:Uncharacterized protein n=1 Tax=Paenibacillus prosopidis TaxID=630520 RepID=A0A368VYY7_9BACL|nr:DUF5693 family protein [Paenibacillus prosopidis]RCW44839.1 hypothetical protein DFP97_11165 [Paenibacillus prosopidis]
MLLRWQQWNRRVRFALWVITLIGVAAALPLGAVRMEMEQTSKQVEYIFDYRDLVEVSELQARPQAFLAEHMDKLKAAGVTTLSVYESTMKELVQSGRLTYYSSRDAALLQGKFEPVGQNFTYILFNGEQEEEMIGPIVRAAFDRLDVPYGNWSYGGRNGMVVEMPVAEALMKTMDFDPMALQAIHDAGFRILPRFSDRVLPYDQAVMDTTLGELKKLGVSRILFEGDKVKGATDQAMDGSLDSFGELLNKYGIGIATIENLKKPQEGINKLAYITNYNVVRLYSLSPDDGMEMTPGAIADRFQLAAKDRNIRMFFLNGKIEGDTDTGKFVHNVDKLILAMGGENGVAAKLSKAGFTSGEPKPFDYEQPSWAKPARGIVAVGAIALITLLVGAFVPGVYIPVFLLGLVGSSGLYVLNSSTMEQALALGAAVSAPTLALVWVMNRIYSRTIGDRRIVGGDDWAVGRSKSSQVPNQPGAISDSGSRMKWVFPAHSMGRRFGMALSWFVVTTLISLVAVPMIFGLLNDITYNLVLEQFRGVSVLHLAPIALVAVYVLFYNGQTSVNKLRTLLSQPITLTWILLAAVIGAIGYYYLSRTGNAGQVSSIELVIRNFLETTFGVRPRFKEFLLGHPLLLLGLFLSLRYRAAWLLVIAGSLGQLTMVDTFAHIHTPLYISIIRIMLGLGTGIIIGCLLIAAWQLVEGALRKWAPAIIRKFVG